MKLPLPIYISHLGLIIAASTYADTVTLGNNDRLSGRITSMKDGIITLDSPLTDSPLLIHQKNLTNLELSPESFTKKTFEEEPERIRFNNGDTLPCTILSMTDEVLTLETWYSGTHEILRSDIDTIQFGIHQEDVIYEGGGDLATWEYQTGTWIKPDPEDFNKNQYISEGRSNITKKLNLSGNLHINYDLSWDVGIAHDFSFCVEGNATKEKTNYYEFSYHGDKITITRYPEDETLPTVILLSDDLPDYESPGKTMNVDIQLDKTKQEITLKIDGEYVGVAYDTNPAPEGQYITISNTPASQKRHTVSNLLITELASPENKRLRVTNLAGTSDILIDNEAEQISGTISSISSDASNGLRIVQFISDTDDSFSIPEHRISTLYFGKPDDVDLPETNATYKISIHGEGSIHVDNIVLTDQEIIASNSVLGSFKLNFKALSHLSQTSPASH